MACQMLSPLYNIVEKLQSVYIPFYIKSLSRIFGETKTFLMNLIWKGYTRVLQKVLSLRLDYFSATFYRTYFYYKPSKYSPFTETHFCNIFTQSRKADK